MGANDVANGSVYWKGNIELQCVQHCTLYTLADKIFNTIKVLISYNLINNLSTLRTFIRIKMKWNVRKYFLRNKQYLGHHHYHVL